MREDMSRVVIERPRAGGKCPSRGRYKVERAYKPRSGWLQSIETDGDRYAHDDDFMPTYMGMRKSHTLRDDRKSFSDLLGPLERFLESRKGLPWNKVYSEVAQHLNRDSVTHAHIYQHLLHMVDTKTAVGDNGEIEVHGRHGIHSVYARFYVCPHTGLLLKNTRRPWRQVYNEQQRAAHRQKIARSMIRLTDTTYYERIDGVWYHVTKSEYTGVPNDPYRDAWDLEPTKRQLGKKEIKKAGLYTGPETE